VEVLIKEIIIIIRSLFKINVRVVALCIVLLSINCRGYADYEAGKWNNYLIKTSGDIGHRWEIFAVSIDEILSGKTLERDPISSDNYLRLNISETLEKYGEKKTKVSVRARLALTHTKKRWRLLFENIEDDNLLNETLNNTSVDDSFQSAALQWIPIGKKKLSVSAGVRNLPINPFVKISFKDKSTKKIKSKEIWSFFKTSVTYSKYDKFVTNIDHLMKFPLDNTLMDITYETRIKWNPLENDIDTLQQLSLEKTYGEDQIFHDVGLSWNNKPNMQLSNCFLRARYRKDLSSQLLYGNLSVTAAFLREDSFKLSPSVKAGLTFLFKKR
jgi:hypothetical protein